MFQQLISPSCFSLFVIIFCFYNDLPYRVGVGKTHNDAASVRTTNPIPAACGLYYFEVKIISKGRDGYMGIGLTAQNFKPNRLPGKSGVAAGRSGVAATKTNSA